MTIHRCPKPGEFLTPCCGQTPFELPAVDKMTLSDELVTCRPSKNLAANIVETIHGMAVEMAWGVTIVLPIVEALVPTFPHPKIGGRKMSVEVSEMKVQNATPILSVHLHVGNKAIFSVTRHVAGNGFRDKTVINDLINAREIQLLDTGTTEALRDALTKVLEWGEGKDDSG